MNNHPRHFRYLRYLQYPSYLPSSILKYLSRSLVTRARDLLLYLILLLAVVYSLDAYSLPPSIVKCIGNLSNGNDTLPVKASLNQDNEFLRYLISVIYVESRFKEDALSASNAYGLMQITEIAAREVERECSLSPLLDMTHLFDASTNIRYGSCYLRKLHRDLHSWTRALIVYNGGYKQLERYEKGQMMVAETANYVLQVERVLSICNGVDK